MRTRVYGHLKNGSLTIYYPPRNVYYEDLKPTDIVLRRGRYRVGGSFFLNPDDITDRYNAALREYVSNAFSGSPARQEQP